MFSMGDRRQRREGLAPHSGKCEVPIRFYYNILVPAERTKIVAIKTRFRGSKCMSFRRCVCFQRSPDLRAGFKGAACQRKGEGRIERGGRKDSKKNGKGWKWRTGKGERGRRRIELCCLATILFIYFIFWQLTIDDDDLGWSREKGSEGKEGKGSEREGRGAVRVIGFCPLANISAGANQQTGLGQFMGVLYIYIFVHHIMVAQQKKNI